MVSMNNKHISVLKEEAIFALDIKKNGIYVDMTLGYAGHSKEILKRLDKGLLIGFDKDIDACNAANEVLKEVGTNYKIINKSFTNLKSTLEELNIEKVDGILFDLGVSSPEIDDVSRGFSYMHDAPLDMRMNQENELDAKKVVNTYKEEELVRIFRLYGEEKHAARIARNIILQREEKDIITTLELVDIISKSYPYKDKRNTHPAKKVFQAIRIEVNNELEEFKTSLKDALNLLNIDGVVAVITFHSLEDKIAKKTFNGVTEVDKVIKGLPNIDQSLLPDYILVNKKAITPSTKEIDNNQRARSAKLRIIKRIK